MDRVGQRCDAERLGVHQGRFRCRKPLLLCGAEVQHLRQQLPSGGQRDQGLARQLDRYAPA